MQIEPISFKGCDIKLFLLIPCVIQQLSPNTVDRWGCLEYAGPGRDDFPAHISLYPPKEALAISIRSHNPLSYTKRESQGDNSSPL